MQADAAPAKDATSDLAPFDTFLNMENEVLRCAAMRAAGAGNVPPGALRTACLAALQDPDPDMRSDAMEALAGVARPEDADTIRYSLALDPVREVKLAAIGILAGLGDMASVPLLRSLCLSRSEDEVAWEDEGSDWEDWLDIQIAAITALGTLGASTGIEDLLTAREDEFGQSVDIAVFSALGGMGPEGVATLIRILRAETGAARTRAAKALAEVAPEALTPHLDTLLGASEASLRRLAVDLLPLDDPRGPLLVEEDPDPAIRAAALERFAPRASYLVFAGIGDADEGVKATAVQLLEPPLDTGFHAALVDNMLAWLTIAGPGLAVTSATCLPRFAPDRVAAALGDLIPDTDRPLDLRIACVRALDHAKPRIPSADLAGHLSNPAQQVRAAVLTLLHARARAGDDAAAEAIAQAIGGTLLPPEAATVKHHTSRDGPDFGTPKEGAGPRRITITRDGEIVENDRDKPDADAVSTLASILAGAEMPPEEPELAEDTPEESSSKRRKRRPVEGPEAVALSLAQDAMEIAGDIRDPRVAMAILARTADGDEALRRAAWRMIGKQPVTDQTIASARKGIEDEDPVIRLACFEVLLRDPDPSTVAKAMADADALIRARTLAHLPVDAASDHLSDDAVVVRRAAVDRLLGDGNPDRLRKAVTRLVKAERADTLSFLLAGSPEALEAGRTALAEGAGSLRGAFVVLEAFAAIPAAHSRAATA